MAAAHNVIKNTLNSLLRFIWDAELVGCVHVDPRNKINKSTDERNCSFLYEEADHSVNMALTCYVYVGIWTLVFVPTFVFAHTELCLCAICSFYIKTVS